jgi:hypothetical protein
MVTPRAALNTDAVIHVLYGHSRDRATVTEAIGGRPVVAAWWVGLEYQLTVVHGFVLFRHLLMEAQSVDDALVSFSSDYRGRVRATVPMLLQQWRGWAAWTDPLLLAERLAVVIQHHLPRRFRQVVPELVGADLWRPYAQLRPPLDLSAFENAFRPDQDPGLPDLLAACAPFLAQVAAYLEQADLRSHPKRTELSHLADLCRRVCARPTMILGHPRLLNHLADLLIALDTPADAELLAFDRIFDVLCAALGKPCRILPSWRTTVTTITPS